MLRSVLVLVLSAMALPAGQEGPPLEIRGRIVAAENGAALPRVRLTSPVPKQLPEAVFTEDDGAFVVRLPAAALPLRLSAAKAGFATRSVEVTRAAIAAGGLEVRLARGAAITGRVVTPAGVPVTGLFVAVQREPDNSGTVPAATAVRVDDRGEYRAGGLEAGRYTLRVVIGAPRTGPQDGIATSVLVRRLSDIDERVRAEALSLAQAGSATLGVTLRPGDDVMMASLVTSASSDGSCPASAPGDADAAATGSIAGRVLDEDGRPLLCARLVLERPTGPSPQMSTDASGRFRYGSLPAGRYRLRAAKDSYSTQWYGQERTARTGRAIALRDGQALDRIDIVLPRPPAVTGLILDDHGAPMEGVSMRAVQLRTVGDMTVAASAASVLSDDRGQYRLFGLTPGNYLISATADGAVSSADGRESGGLAPVFYPGTADIAGATPVEVRDDDVGGITLVFTGAPTRRISGVALSSSGVPAPVVTIFPSQRSSAIMLQPRQVPVRSDGTFSASGFAPGEYVVQAMPALTFPRPTEVPEFGMQYVTVSDRDPGPVNVRTSPGATVRGRQFVRDGGEAPLIGLRFLPTDFDRSPAGGLGGSGIGRVTDGEIVVAGVTGLRRLILISPQDGWFIESATIGGQDVLDRPFDFGLEARVFSDLEVILSNASSSVTGRVVDGAGAAVTDYAVAVFAADRSLWYRSSQRLRGARSGRDGTFSVSGLPSGDYLVAAIDTRDGLDQASGAPGEWEDVTLLQRLAPRAQRVTLSEREVHQGRFTLQQR